MEDKAFENTWLMLRTFNELRNFPNLIKISNAFLKLAWKRIVQEQSYTILLGKRLDTFALRVEKRQECHFIPFIFKITLESLLNAIREEKEIKVCILKVTKKNVFNCTWNDGLCRNTNEYNNSYNKWVNIAKSQNTKSIYKS